MQTKKRPNELLEKNMPKYLIGAFSIVTALAWNDLIKYIFTKYISDDETLAYKVLYTIAVTIVLIIAIMIIYQAHDFYFTIKDIIFKYNYALAVYNNSGYITFKKLNENIVETTILMNKVKPNTKHNVHIKNKNIIFDIKSNNLGRIFDKKIIYNITIKELLNNHIYIYDNKNIYKSIITTQ